MIFLKAGILTTIQDLGRVGHRSFGINPNGAMDKDTVRLLNILLENDENEGTLEMHLPAAELLFEEDCTIAIGSSANGNNAMNLFKRINVKVGEVLRFPHQIAGSRIYLAVKGGFESENWLNSVSTNLITGVGKKMEKGDQIKLKNPMVLTQSNFSVSTALQHYNSTKPTIRILAGNEYPFLDEYSKQNLENQAFTITNDSNRMGYRLNANQLKLKTSPLGEKELSLLSSAVEFGTIQLLPSGQLIILMADHQTTGGYPRIGHVISIDLPVLAQLKSGDAMKFQTISIEHAQELVFLRDENFRKLKVGISLIAS
jgi:antagonist of KipI